MSVTRAARTASALVGLGVLVGCGGSATDDTAEGKACAAPTPASKTDGLPKTLDLESFGTVTEVVREGGFVNATAVTDGTIGSVHEEFSRHLEEVGYAIVGSENEVIEADVFFAQGQGTTGGAKFIETGCADRVRIQLFVGGDGAAGG